MTTVKDTVKHLLDRHPRLLKGNRVFHAIERYRAYRKVRLRPELTTRPDLLEALDRDGIVVIEDYVPRETARQWLAAIDVVVARMKQGQLSKFLFPTAGFDYCRIAWADSLVPASRAFFDDPLLHGLARAYLSPDVASYRREIDYKGGPHDFVVGELLHYDNWRPSVKAFLYLTDVTERTAPFVYAPGTHKLAPWRTRFDIEFDVEAQQGRNGHFFPQEVSRLRREIGLTERTYTGPAGTLLLADFRGLHRGTRLWEDRRVLLNNTWGLMDPPVGPPPPMDA